MLIGVMTKNQEKEQISTYFELVISWNSKQQDSFALSSTETEYIAIAHLAQEA